LTLLQIHKDLIAINKKLFFYLELPAAAYTQTLQRQNNPENPRLVQPFAIHNRKLGANMTDCRHRTHLTSNAGI